MHRAGPKAAEQACMGKPCKCILPPGSEHTASNQPLCTPLLVMQGHAADLSQHQSGTGARGLRSTALAPDRWSHQGDTAQLVTDLRPRPSSKRPCL